MCCHDHSVSRRDFVTLMPAAAAAPLAPLSAGGGWEPSKPFDKRFRKLVVEPVLLYSTPEKKFQNSWKSWGGVQTEATAGEETARIEKEWAALKAQADFPIEVKPAVRAKSVEAVAALPREANALRVVYPATGSGAMLRAALGESGDALIFVRHRSGPVYYWYEALSTRYLGKSGEAARLTVDDVVVDDPKELLWRVRATAGVKTFLNSKVLALGGEWGKYAPEAPRVARERFGMEIVDYPYEEFGKRMRSVLADKPRMARAEAEAAKYLALPGTRLETQRPFVVNSFALYGLWKEMMAECGAHAFTIKSCMGTVMPMAETTACLALEAMNDEGIPAYCESDFVVIPPCLFLRSVTGLPVFQHNSTFPHNGVVTCAHCTGPRRMNGVRYEPARILTHYESDYGAAPKVEMPVGQAVTFINPEYATCRWLGMKGVVEANPYMPICVSQQDVKIAGDWRRLLNEVRDSHWAMVYGDWLRDAGWAARRAGVKWESIS